MKASPTPTLKVFSKIGDITYEIPLPQTWKLTFPVKKPAFPWLNLNDRPRHWSTKASQTKAWRKIAWAKAKQAGIPTLAAATITGRIYKNRAGRYDPHNLYPTLKAIVDGLVDAGVLEDDDYTRLEVHLAHGGIRRGQDPHLEITITERNLEPMNTHHVSVYSWKDQSGRHWHRADCTCGWEQVAGTFHHADALARKHESKHR